MPLQQEGVMAETERITRQEWNALPESKIPDDDCPFCDNRKDNEFRNVEVEGMGGTKEVYTCSNCENEFKRWSIM